jgi:hypothetical protein
MPGTKSDPGPALPKNQRWNEMIDEMTPRPAASINRKWSTVARVSAFADFDFIDKTGARWEKASGFTGGNLAIQNGPISGTNTPEIYHWERWGNYKFARQLPDGHYQVRLYFSERASGVNEAGQRVFRVAIQGSPLSYVDVFAEGGGRDKAVVRSAEADVDDGWLRINFVHAMDRDDVPILNAIEILRADEPTTKPSGGNELPTGPTPQRQSN